MPTRPMKKGPPFYDFSEFQTDCSKGNVLIFKAIEIRANVRSLNLFTERQILDYLSAPLDGLSLDNSCPLIENICNSKGQMVDSYKFGFCDETWYFAFFKTPKGVWVLKSLKRSTVLQVGKEESVSKGNQLEEALNRAIEGKKK